MAINGPPSLYEWALGVGAALGALLVTIFGLRKRRHNEGGHEVARPATQLDLAKLEARLLEQDRLTRHETYNRMQVMTSDYALEDDKLMKRMEELFKNVYMRLDRHSDKLTAVATDVAVLKTRMERDRRS